MALAAGSRLYVGGAFTTLGGQPRASLGSVDLTTGVVTAWNPGTNGTVTALAVHGATIYAGGTFTTAAGAFLSNLAAFDDATVVGVPDVPVPLAGHRLRTEPNPMRDQAQIRFVLPSSGPVTLDLLDLAGRRVKRILSSASRDAGPQELRIERQGLPGGLYFLDLRGAGGSARQKLVVLP
jgi:hypothetical protein